MKWTFKLNGKQVTWEIADNLVAIPPSPDLKPAKNEFPQTPSKREGNNGYKQKRPNYNGYKPKRSELDREIYERAGWRFVDPAQAGTADVRKVFLTERDDLLIETKLATVQLAEPAYLQATPEKILAEDGLEIVQRLSCLSASALLS